MLRQTSKCIISYLGVDGINAHNEIIVTKTMSSQTCCGPREMYAWSSRTSAWMFPGLSHNTGMRRN